MPRLRKTLPKDIDKLMGEAADSGDYSAVHAVLEKCDVDARHGSGKETALMLGNCTPELAKWLVDRGADLEAVSKYGAYTALHCSARAPFHFKLGPQTLIDLGADIHARTGDGRTPLHLAVESRHLKAVKVLLAAGAELSPRHERDLTPLEYGLAMLSNTSLERMVPVVEFLLEAGAEPSAVAQEKMTKAAETFQFHRAGYNRDSVEAAATAMTRLCALLDVPVPEERKVFDGTSPIIASSDRWQDQHKELWGLLVPSKGACTTVQGEVIRIAGRLGDEMHRNGGINWNKNHRAMVKAFCHWITTGNALSDEQVAECQELGRRLPAEIEPCRRLTELSTVWVAQNPNPVELPAPDYKI